MDQIDEQVDRSMRLWRAARCTPMPMANVDAKIAVTRRCVLKISKAAELPAKGSKPFVSIRSVLMPARSPWARKPARRWRVVSIAAGPNMPAISV